MPKPTSLEAQIAAIDRKLRKAKNDVIVIHHDITRHPKGALATEKAARIAHQRAENNLKRRQERQGVLKARVELYEGEIAELRKLLPEGE